MDIEKANDANVEEEDNWVEHLFDWEPPTAGIPERGDLWGIINNFFEVVGADPKLISVLRNFAVDDDLSPQQIDTLWYSARSTEEEITEEIRISVNKVMKKTIRTAWINSLSRDRVLQFVNALYSSDALTPPPEDVEITIYNGTVSCNLTYLVHCWNEINPEEKPIRFYGEPLSCNPDPFS